MISRKSLDASNVRFRYLKLRQLEEIGNEMLQILTSDACGFLHTIDGHQSLQTNFVLKKSDKVTTGPRKQNSTDHSFLFHLAWLDTFQFFSWFSSFQFNFFLVFFLFLFHFPFAHATAANDDEENNTHCSSNYIIFVLGPDTTGLAF